MAAARRVDNYRQRFIPLLDRLLAGSIPEPNSGCWIWEGTIATSGYGWIYAGRRLYTHRASYALHCGPVPDGKVVRHRCDVPLCINPAHLILGTQAENIGDTVRRGRHGSSIKTHCPRGHPYDAANTRVYAGRRVCHACLTLRRKAQRL